VRTRGCTVISVPGSRSLAPAPGHSVSGGGWCDGVGVRVRALRGSSSPLGGNKPQRQKVNKFLGSRLLLGWCGTDRYSDDGAQLSFLASPRTNRTFLPSSRAAPRLRLLDEKKPRVLAKTNNPCRTSGQLRLSRLPTIPGAALHPVHFNCFLDPSPSPLLIPLHVALPPSWGKKRLLEVLGSPHGAVCRRSNPTRSHSSVFVIPLRRSDRGPLHPLSRASDRGGRSPVQGSGSPKRLSRQEDLADCSRP
jgi:hypothetical protein